MMATSFWSLAGLFLLTFVSEDAATLSGGYLASTKTLGWLEVFLACFLGIWVGDIALYVLGRYCGRPVINWLWRNKARVNEKVVKSEEWFRLYGLLSLVICRIVPGMRLPTYLSAGFLRMAILPFCVATGILAALWVLLFFWMVHRLGKAAPELFHALRQHIVWAGVALVGLLLLLNLLMFWIRRLRLPRWLKQWQQWEFWPAWIFYLPVVANYLRLSLKYGGATLPSCANPGMFLSGLIGESKFETLAELQETSPLFVAQSFLLVEGKDRAAILGQLISEGGLHYPLVLKPDMGQRGDGFKVIRTAEEAALYLDRVPVAVVAQQYIAGPHEVGIFYYRFPEEEKGHILAMTEKIFPMITGDGVQTVEELIQGDERASILAETYLCRFEKNRQVILNQGERLRLVEAGNHAQGCIFKDGIYLWSTELEERIDAISQRINSFYIGRYDLRYASTEELIRGENFHILELNGASSEATSAYDASNTLAQAYGLLFKQWDLVFSIAAQNRKYGHQPASALLIISQWMNYRRRSQSYPQAD